MIMKILFDFISIQGYVNGGAEHAKRILCELHSLQTTNNLNIFALYDSNIPFVGEDRNAFSHIFERWIDINKIKSIGDYCKGNKIDVFYIGIGQRLLPYNLLDIECKTIIVIHDIDFVELYSSPVIIKKKIPLLIKRTIKQRLYKLVNKNVVLGQDKNSFALQQNFFLKNNVYVVTVSEFSKCSLMYNLPFLRGKKIYVFYSPLKVETTVLENSEVKALIEQKIPYFVSLNSNRTEKNVELAVNVIGEVSEIYPCKIVTTGGLPSKHKNHVSLGYVSDGELNYLIRNAQALVYPTFIEGFGYPPIEAMKYGVPVITSRVTSIPEILADSAIYFNPMFESEMYKAFMEFMNADKDTLRSKALKQYSVVAQRQERDLISLLRLITES